MNHNFEVLANPLVNGNNNLWGPSLIDVQAGTMLIISASQNTEDPVKIQNRAKELDGPDGKLGGNSSAYSPNNLVKDADFPTHALVGKVGVSEQFLIGYGTTYHVKESGKLFLSINDQESAFTDNSGKFDVSVIVRTGTITTIAGTGTAGSNGDNGPATNAELNGPSGIAVDNKGNILITEYRGRRVRKVDSSGKITTYAGTGVEGNSGDNGPATHATFRTPSSVAVDKFGNVLITDGYGDRVRKVDSSGTITAFVGGGSGRQFSRLWGIAVDSSDNVYFCETDSSPGVHKVNTSGHVSDVLGSDKVRWPSGIAVDKKGNLFIADSWKHRVLKVDSSGKITTYAGTGSSNYSGDNGPATSAELKSPAGLAVDSVGNLYIADKSNHRVRMVDSRGIITTVAGDGIPGSLGDGGPATSARINSPNDVAIDQNDDLYIVDSVSHRIRKVQ